MHIWGVRRRSDRGPGFEPTGGTVFSCTPDRNCHTFCLGDKIASHPGVLTQA